MAEWMNLYEVQQKFLEVIDEETGEIKISEEELEELIKSEEMALEYFIRLYKNKMAFVKALREEEKLLADRRHKIEKSCEGILGSLDKYLQGNKYECKSGSLNYRKSTAVVPTDEMSFLKWEGRFLYGSASFVADKDAIKRAINEGSEIPGWAIEQRLNASIK